MTQRRRKETAQQAYEAAMADISNLMGWLECELEKAPETIQWPHVGNLNYIRQNLLETLAFKSGHDIESLKESLEDARIY